jgi:hypothetical protein
MGNPDDCVVLKLFIDELPDDGISMRVDTKNSILATPPPI